VRAKIGPLFTLLAGLLRAQVRLRAARDLLLPRLVSGEIGLEGLDIVMPDCAA
jgi:hypothetical protein